MNELLLVESIVIARVQVLMINNIPDLTPVTFHCQSQGRDLGVRNVPTNGPIEWYMDIYNTKNEAAYCDIRYRDLHGYFDIYETERDYRSGRCGNNQCLWSVRKDGLYLYNKKENIYEFQFGWQ
ncbi:self-incompatibility protein S1-like [Cornus florida]|uniref:self-incompatibility protein S1-like n=1 Tax=Cornus florida TaxID=4283 RepID=UPI00289E9E33|nr:self-incompatibility protein S1-like [Cornus florida]